MKPQGEGDRGSGPPGAWIRQVSWTEGGAGGGEARRWVPGKGLPSTPGTPVLSPGSPGGQDDALPSQGTLPCDFRSDLSTTCPAGV